MPTLQELKARGKPWCQSCKESDVTLHVNSRNKGRVAYICNGCNNARANRYYHAVLKHKRNA